MLHAVPFHLGATVALEAHGQTEAEGGEVGAYLGSGTALLE